MTGCSGQYDRPRRELGNFMQDLLEGFGGFEVTKVQYLGGSGVKDLERPARACACADPGAMFELADERDEGAGIERRLKDEHTLVG